MRTSRISPKVLALSTGQSQKELFEKYYEEFFSLLENYVLVVLDSGDIYSARAKVIEFLIDMYSVSFLEEVAFILDELGVPVTNQDIINIQNSVDTSSFLLSNRERISSILVTHEQNIQELLTQGLTREEVIERYHSELTRLASSELHMGVEKASVQGAKLLEAITGTRLYKTWNCVGDSKTCPTCLAMNGVTVPVTHPFLGEDVEESIASQLSYVGGEITYAHPRCRCWVTYSTA
mgnify:FL=1